MSVYYLFYKAADALRYLVFAFEQRAVEAVGRAAIEGRARLKIGVDEAGQLFRVIETGDERSLTYSEKETPDNDIGRCDKPNCHTGRVHNVYVVAEAGSSSATGYYQVLIAIGGNGRESGCLHVAESLLAAIGENTTDCLACRLLDILVEVDKTSAGCLSQSLSESCLTRGHVADQKDRRTMAFV